MTVNRNNVIDTIMLYMEDNDYDYVYIRASKGVTGDVKMYIATDIEFEDEDDDEY
jgi:hypothetical protein